jgi:hypothetical protein
LGVGGLAWPRGAARGVRFEDPVDAVAASVEDICTSEGQYMELRAASMAPPPFTSDGGELSDMYIFMGSYFFVNINNFHFILQFIDWHNIFFSFSNCVFSSSTYCFFTIFHIFISLLIKKRNFHFKLSPPHPLFLNQIKN